MTHRNPSSTPSPEKPWPFFGYAPGNYMATCDNCGEVKSDLDKRAISCLECAVLRAKAYMHAARSNQEATHARAREHYAELKGGDDVDTDAFEAALAARSNQEATPDAVELRHRLRMIISHASGGHLHEPSDIDRSVNDICVEISRHHNRVWEHAQEVALRDAAKPVQEATRTVGDAELREALEPFAVIARDSCLADHDDSYAPRPSRGRPNMRDYRRARDVLDALSRTSSCGPGGSE